MAKWLFKKRSSLHGVAKKKDCLLKPVRLLIAALLRRAKDPEPEAPNPKAGKKYFASVHWLWLPLLALLSAAGLLLIAYAYSHTRNEGTAKLRTYFYPALILLFTPMVIRLLVPSTPRTERIVLLCITGISCYLLKILASPLHFYQYDEFLHWRTGNDLISSGHLFTPNSLLPVSPFYPGLEIATSAISMLSGLDFFHSALILIGMARLLMTLTLFGLNEELFHSARLASLAAALYMVNPHYLFFDTQYAYESLALPLALVIFFIMAPYQTKAQQMAHQKALAFSALLPSGSSLHARESYKTLRADCRAMILMAFVMLLGVTFSHHATDFFFIGLLFLWAVLYRMLRIARVYQSPLTWLALAGLVFAIIWIEMPNNPVVPYLSGFLSTVFSNPGKHFATSVVNSYGPMSWEKNLAQYSTYAMLLLLPFGLLCLWHRYRTHALACQLGLTSLGLIASQGLRSTDSGIQLADRASAVLFIAVSSVFAIFFVQFWPTRRLRWHHIIILASVITILFLAGYISSGGSGYGSPPTSYVVGADSRSLDMEGIEAAIWSYHYLGSNNHVGTDRTNQLLMATYGNQRIIDTIADHVDVAPIFFSLPFDSESLDLIKRARITYLVVDRRLSTSPPAVGEYFEKGEPGAMQHITPVSLDALMKFDTMPQVNKVFDGGDLVIFDIRELLHAHKNPAP